LSRATTPTSRRALSTMVHGSRPTDPRSRRSLAIRSG
jgi:hypothetical protein